MKIKLLAAFSGLVFCAAGVRAHAQASSSGDDFVAALSIPAGKIVAQAKGQAAKPHNAPKAPTPKVPGYVGIVLSQTAKDPTIVETMPGMPAERAGLRYGDVISKVNGHSVLGLKAAAASKFLRGVDGSSVRITVLRASGSREFSVVRRKPEPGQVLSWDILGALVSPPGDSGTINHMVYSADYTFSILEPGGPSDLAGVRDNDRLIAVNGQPTRGITQDELYRRLRGAPGASVKVQISRQERAGGPWVKHEFSIKRDELSAPLAVDNGKMAPDFSLTTVDGRQVSLGQLRGKIVLLEFSTTWCGACQGDEPAMAVRYQKYAARGLEIFRVDPGEQKQTVLNYTKAHHLPYPVLLDENQAISSAYLVSGFPSFFLIGPQGQLVQRHVGDPDWGVPNALESEIEAALDASGL